MVGMTGGGKTTLIQLLAGFYAPQQGEIRIDDRELGTFPKKELRSLVGLVPQEVFLFEGDPDDNIFLGEDREQDAPRAVLSHSKELQGLLRTLAGRRVATLSAGERQLVALARVLVRNPRILVLDEATAHIDARTEEQVQAAAGAAGRPDINHHRPPPVYPAPGHPHRGAARGETGGGGDPRAAYGPEGLLLSALSVAVCFRKRGGLFYPLPRRARGFGVNPSAVSGP